MAFTERYVTTSGSSSNGGTNDTTDAWDFQTGWQSVGLGIRLNVKAGTYNLNFGGVGITNGGTAPTAASPAWIRGYTTTPGDLVYSRDSNGNLVTTGMPTINLSAQDRLQTVACVMLEGLNISGSRSNELMYVGGYAWMYNCKILNNYNTGFSVSSAISVGDFAQTIVGCDSIKTGTDAAYSIIANAGTSIVGCKITGAAGIAICVFSGCFAVIDCVIYDSTIGVQIASISFGQSPCVSNNTFYNCTTCAIDLPNSGNMPYCNIALVNNHVTDCNRFYNNNYTSVTQFTMIKNRTRDNTNADVNVGDWPAKDALTVDNGNATSDYVNATSKNFFLKPTAVGRSTGLMRYRDVGAMQSPSSSNSVF